MGFKEISLDLYRQLAARPNKGCGPYSFVPHPFEWFTFIYHL